jgi:hypothetical protein
MGLDMYLNKNTYLGLNWEHNRKDGYPLEITSDKLSHIKVDRISEIVEQVGYWRKANAIHAWFVNNVQEGNDNCESYYVDENQLKALLDTVNKVMESTKLVDGKVLEDPTVAKELLPTTEGFFFGPTDYDQYYWQDLELTKEILEGVLGQDGDSYHGSIYYRSSW